MRTEFTPGACRESGRERTIPGRRRACPRRVLREWPAVGAAVRFSGQVRAEPLRFRQRVRSRFASGSASERAGGAGAGGREQAEMRYERIFKASFIERPNRFIAYVELDGRRRRSM